MDETPRNFAERDNASVVKAWLEAELDAELFLADPRNSPEVVKMAKEQTTGFSKRVLWYSLYGAYDPAAGGSPVRVYLPYAFTSDARELISRAWNSCIRLRASTSKS